MTLPSTQRLDAASLVSGAKLHWKKEESIIFITGCKHLPVFTHIKAKGWTVYTFYCCHQRKISHVKNFQETIVAGCHLDHQWLLSGIESNQVINLTVIISHEKVWVDFRNFLFRLKLCQYEIEMPSICYILLELNLKPLIVYSLFDDLHICLTLRGCPRCPFLLFNRNCIFKRVLFNKSPHLF